MALIRDIAALFQSKNILVDIDPILLPHIKSPDKLTVQRTISFNLYRLIYHIGTIQSRRFAVSNRMKFLDKVDLIEKIYINTNDFRIKISEITQINGSETLKSISEDFGIGISVVIAESLFDTKRSTIERIIKTGRGRRPDWKCQLNDNRIFVAEGKGSTSIATSNTQQVRALTQKLQEPGDIRVASLTVLNENTISTNRYIDPPIENDIISPEMQNHILRAGHYASVFSFFGNSRLSKYYSQMRKRLEGFITSQEQNIKDQVFRDLRFNAPTITFKQQEFVGTFYMVANEKYLFVGVDKRLLSYEGFITYNEFENDVEEVIGNNMYVLYKDGVLVIEIFNIIYFSSIISPNEIENYQENISIRDIDEMNEISFLKYFEYILIKNGFTSLREQTISNDLRVDLVATKNNQMYYFEFKILRRKRISRRFLQQISEYSNLLDSGKTILVTNARINYTEVSSNKFDIIDRIKLIQIAKNSSLLRELIE